MDNLKTRHADEGLDMAVSDVGGNVAVVNALHIGVKDRQCHLQPSRITSGSVELRGIAGNAHNLAVTALDVATRLGGMGFLHHSRLMIDEGDISILVVIVGDAVCQFRTVILRRCAASTRESHRRHGSTVAANVVK